MSLSRETLKWVLSLDLSYPVKNVRRDFANGFLFAEVLSRYYPAEVQLHSFENVASTERKKANWHLLEKLFKRKNIAVDRTQIEGVMAADGDAAVEMLHQLHAFINSPAYDASQGVIGYMENEAAAGWPARPEALPAYAPYQIPGAIHNSYGEAHTAPAFIPLQQGPAAAHGAFGQGHAYSALQGAIDPCLLPAGAHEQQMQGAGVPPQWQLAAPSQGYVGAGHSGPSYAGWQHECADAAHNSPPCRVQQHISPGQVKAARAVNPTTSPASKTGPKQKQGSKAGSSPPQQCSAAPAIQQVYAPAQQGIWSEQMQMQQQWQQHTAYLPGWGPTPPAGMQGAGVYGVEQYRVQMQGVPIGYDYASYAAGMQEGTNSSCSPSKADNIPFSKARPVEYQPYDMKDFEGKTYNVKRQGAGYWQLGRLGPDLETPELQAKREKAERLKAMAAQVRDENMKKAAAAAVKPRKEAAKEPSARDRALQFAKQVPKPEAAVKADNSTSAPAGKPGSNSGGKGSRGNEQGRMQPADSPSQQLQLLEAQHVEDQRKVEAIRAQLARML